VVVVKVVEFPEKVKTGVDNQVKAVESLRDSAINTFNFVKKLVPKPKESSPPAAPSVPKGPPNVEEIWEAVAPVKKEEEDVVTGQPIVTLASTTTTTTTTTTTPAEPALKAVIAAPEVAAKLQEIPSTAASAADKKTEEEEEEEEDKVTPIVTLESKLAEGPSMPIATTLSQGPTMPIATTLSQGPTMPVVERKVDDAVASPTKEEA